MSCIDIQCAHFNGKCGCGNDHTTCPYCPSNKTSWTCSRCQKSTSSKFCPDCGSPSPSTVKSFRCSQCRTNDHSPSDHCSNCGRTGHRICCSNCLECGHSSYQCPN